MLGLNSLSKSFYKRGDNSRQDMASGASSCNIPLGRGQHEMVSISSSSSSPRDRRMILAPSSAAGNRYREENEVRMSQLSSLSVPVTENTIEVASGGAIEEKTQVNPQRLTL